MSDQQRQIMTDAEFEALCAWLESPEGCNFQQEIPGDIASMTWTCDGTLKLTRQWMQAHGVDEGLLIRPSIISPIMDMSRMEQRQRRVAAPLNLQHL